MHQLFIVERLCRHAKILMHIVKQGGVKELARQTGSFQEPAVCLIDGLRAINRMQLGQTWALAHTHTHTPHTLPGFLFLHGI